MLFKCRHKPIINGIIIFIIVLFLQCIHVKAIDSGYYTALGDSIAFGMNAEHGKGYVDQLYYYFKTSESFKGIELHNLSVPGAKSTNLLGVLNNENTKEAIVKSKIITISMGGNNLVSPIISSIARTFNVDINSPDFSVKLAKAVEDNPSKLQGVFQEIINPKKLPAELNKSVDQFNKDWPKIITEIKQLAPNSKIFVLTLYNPFHSHDIFFNILDKSVQSINNTIKASRGQYYVVDVYDLFKQSTDGALTNFDWAQGNLDPHPNTEGHNVIYKAHIDVLKNALLAKTPSNTIASSSKIPFNYAAILIAVIVLTVIIMILARKRSKRMHT